MSRNGKFLLLLAVIAVLSASTVALAGCGPSKGTNNSEIEQSEKTTENTKNDETDKVDTKIVEKYNINLQLESFSLPGVFSIDKPKGWKVYKAGEYNTFAFLTRDENEPLRQCFMFGDIGIFYVSEQQKQLEASYQNNGGYKVPWIDMPVVSPFNGATFLQNFSSIMNSQIGKGFLEATNMPIPSGFDQIEIISQEEITPLFPGMSTFLVRAVLIDNGEVAQGIFTLSTYSDAYGHGTAFLVSGVTAPVNEFNSVKETLLTTLNSFKFDETYVAKGSDVIRENGERFKQISQTINETSDIITKGYNERSKSSDIRIGKKNDEVMGVERVYDADTGEVYEVENGFYDYYKTHQEQYKLKELQPLPDNNYDLWNEAPKINHSLVIPK